jgi:type II secretory pathway component PulF
VAAGESSGKLPAMLNRIAAMARKQLHIRKTIAGAMIYPAALLCIALGVLAVLLLLVIPRFGELFVSLDAPLPPTTAAMVALSRLVRTYWWLGLLGVAGPAVGLWLWLPTPQARKVIETVLLRLPQVGRIARSLATARVARVLGVLLESHLDAVDALRLARQSAGNHHYAALLAKAEDAIISGQPMSLAFCESDLISPSVSEAIRSGEQSGQVAPLLLNAADFLDEENELVVRSLVSLVEPAVLLLMGLVVGVVAVSMFMPLFDLTSMTQGGK